MSFNFSERDRLIRFAEQKKTKSAIFTQTGGDSYYRNTSCQADADAIMQYDITAPFECFHRFVELWKHSFTGDSDYLARIIVAAMMKNSPEVLDAAADLTSSGQIETDRLDSQDEEAAVKNAAVVQEIKKAALSRNVYEF